MSRTWSTRRKSLAIGLAVVGVAGLSLASASQLGFNWTASTFQAGVVPTVSTDCQPSTEKITAAYTAPQWTGGSTSPWAVQSITFTGVDKACDAKNFDVAYSTAAGASTWTQYASASGKVVATSTTPGSNTVTVTVPSVDLASITGWALTIHS